MTAIINSHMADFDPYYQWLAIPPKDQPPNHYRLLGVELFESNVEAIANAADQRMMHVRSFQTGKYSDLSQKLLNEIAVAKICLLNAGKKAAYDQQLRQQSAVPPPAQLDRADFPNPPPIASKAVPATMATPGPPSDKRAIWLGLGLLAGGALVLAMVLALNLGRGDKQVASSESKPLSAAATPSEQEFMSPESREDIKEHVKPAEVPHGITVPENRHELDARAMAPKTRAPVRPGSPEATAPPKEAAASKPAAESGKSGATLAQKPDGPTPSSPLTTHPQPEGNPKDAGRDSKESPTKEISAVEAKPKPGDAKAKPTEAEGRPKEKPEVADPAARPNEKAPIPVVSFPPLEKRAVPDEAIQERTLASIRETYEAGYRAAEKAALAWTLIEKADESRSDATARFMLLREAKNLAVETGHGELAFALIDALASEYRIPAAEMKAEILLQAAKNKKIGSPQERETIVEAALSVADEAIAEENVDLAKKMVKLAILLAPPTRDRELIHACTTKNKELETRAKICADVKTAIGTLKAEASNPVANLVLGKYLCFTKNDWENGLPRLARSRDAALRALAERDIHGPTVSEEQIELGDAWWTASGKQRAAYWYEKAMPRLKTLDKDRVTGRIKNEPVGKRVVDLLAWADPDRDDSDGKWGKWARNGADVACISFPPLTDGKQDDCATLALPVEVNGQYDLLVSFTRNKVGAPERDEILIDFPVGMHFCAFAIGETGSGLGNIDGKNCYRNSTTTSVVKLVDGRRYTLLLRVRRIGESAAIDVLLDNQPLIHWQGMETSLSTVSPYIQQVMNLPLRFFLSTRSLTTFHAAELRIVSGRAKWAL